VQFTITAGNTSEIFYIGQALLDAKASELQKSIATSGSDRPVLIKMGAVDFQTFSLFVK
jgi:hypothetical protein